MGETVAEKIKANVKADNQIYLQGGHYIAVDSSTLEERADGTFVAKGRRKVAGLFWDPTLEHVSVIYDSAGKFIDYDPLSEE